MHFGTNLDYSEFIIQSLKHSSLKIPPVQMSSPCLGTHSMMKLSCYFITDKLSRSSPSGSAEGWMPIFQISTFPAALLKAGIWRPGHRSPSTFLYHTNHHYNLSYLHNLTCSCKKTFLIAHYLSSNQVLSQELELFVIYCLTNLFSSSALSQVNSVSR